MAQGPTLTKIDITINVYANLALYPSSLQWIIYSNRNILAIHTVKIHYLMEYQRRRNGPEPLSKAGVN